jgi:hypothetical protein
MSEIQNQVPAAQADGAMTPEKKFELLRMLLESGAEVRTHYKRRRVMSVERMDSHVVLTYHSGECDKIHIRDLMRRRFVVML